MSGSESENIFNLASQKAAKKAAGGPLPSRSQPPATEEEIKRQQEQVLKWRKDIEEGLDKVYKATGFTNDTLTAYLDNPSNFKLGEWPIIQELRQMRKGELNMLLGEEIQEAASLQKRASEQQRKKGKTLGARRKWIDMR